MKRSIPTFLCIMLAAALSVGLVAASTASAQTVQADQAKVAKKNPVKVSTATSEARSSEPERSVRPIPFMFGLFDAQKPAPVELNEEQLKHDEKLSVLARKKPPKIDDRFKPQTVPFSGYRPGTIVIDTKEKFLYFVESPVAAVRYGVAVGKEGLLFTGKATVGDKQVWPRWIPTKAMIERDPRQYQRYADGMDGGPDNPLGARAIYLYQGKQDTYLRIHGTNQPNTIGSAASNGCFRMINEHVIDLFDRVQLGAQVVVL